MQSREYQEKHIAGTVEGIETYRTICSHLPTGGGKTVEFGMIIKMFLHKKLDIEHGPVLIIVHREELLNQAARSIKEILGFDPCLITSNTSRFWISRVYIGMVESTISRLHMILNPSLIIIDECHIQSFNKIHKQFPKTKIIGFSATPLSVNKKEPLKSYYQKIVCGPSIKELINLGFLSQNITRAPKVSVDSSQFVVDRLKNDFNERQMSQVYSMADNVENCVNKYFEFCVGKKTLVFNVTIETSKKVTDCFVACGYNARHLDAESSRRPSKDPRCKTEREEIFLWFKETPDAILNSVMIPTMGFDEPTVQSVILNFSTLSLPKFIQCCGRGSRIIDEYFIEKFQINYPYTLKTKQYFDIIDLGQNWQRFGDWNDERDWEQIFYYPDLPGQGVSPVKSCPSCEALVHAAVRLCPYCSHEFEKRRREQLDMEEMILITKGIDIDSLVEKSEKKYKYYAFFELAIDIVDNMFHIHGKSFSQEIVNRFFRAYYKLCIEWFNKTIAGKDGEMNEIDNSGWHIRKARNNFNQLIQRKNKDSKVIEDGTEYQLITKTDEEIRENNIRWEKIKETELTK